jgi:U3 small nucleolar RNA-associated protein 14
MKGRPAEKKAKPKAKSSGSSKQDNDVYQYENDKIRNQNDRAGDISDDSDGELKGEDESIDDDGSEVGWDSDDEMAYGHLFKGKGSSKNSSSSSSSAQVYDSESDQEEAFEGEMLLSDMFTSNKGTSKTADKKADSKKQIEEEDNVSDEGDDDDDDDEDNEDDDDDEEDDEDSEGDDDEEEDEEDDNEDGNNDAHNRLMEKINKFSKVEENASGSKRKKLFNQSAQESIFSSVADDGAVSMDALLGALGEAKGLNVVKKQLIDLENGTAVPSHVEKVISDRAERSLAYEGISLEMMKWQETVTANRHIKTLDLAQDKRLIPSYKDLVKKFKPTTNMEREVQMILVSTGATDEQAEQREEDELGSRNFSVEELKERQAELSKVKALMFYEQMKRHRLNKIKSKAYRRIRKRQKNKKEGDEGLEDMDPEQAREEEEKEATRRVKERMDMKHKNTGKWARMALQHGHHDASLRLVIKSNSLYSLAHISLVA